jgi:hypothetical protein
MPNFEDVDYGHSRMFGSGSCYWLAAFIGVVAVVEIALHPSRNIGWCSGLLVLAAGLVAVGRYWRRHERKQDERAGI